MMEAAMDKNSFPKWFYELPMQVQHALQYREQNPYRNVQYISHLSPDEIREALLHPELNALRLYADPNDKEETEKEVLALLRHIAWETDTAVYTQLPEQLNHYKFVRHYGNKAMVVHWDYQTRMIYQSIAEFKNSHIDKFIAHWNPKTGQWERRPLVEVWLKDPRTPKYDSVEFLPGVEHEIDHPGILNSWRGWPCNTAYVDYSDNEPEACRLFLNHMYDNLCGGDADVYTYLLGWMADALINPHRTSEVAIVLRGAQGSGKTFWANRFMSLFTPHTLTLDKPNQVTGNFNKHLEDKCVVFADEAFFAGNHQHAATLKTLITSDEIFIEPKGVDGYMAKKLFRVIIASNDEHVIRAEIDDRRYLVLDVDAGAHNQDGAYFKAIAEENLSSIEISYNKFMNAEELYNFANNSFWGSEKLINPMMFTPIEILKDISMINRFLPGTRKIAQQTVELTSNLSKGYEHMLEELKKGEFNLGIFDARGKVTRDLEEVHELIFVDNLNQIEITEFIGPEIRILIEKMIKQRIEIEARFTGRIGPSTSEEETAKIFSDFLREENLANLENHKRIIEYMMQRNLTLGRVAKVVEAESDVTIQKSVDYLERMVKLAKQSGEDFQLDSIELKALVEEYRRLGNLVKEDYKGFAGKKPANPNELIK